MKKLVSLILILCLVLGCMAFASAETQTASARGFASDVTVEVTLEDGKVTGLTVDDSGPPGRVETKQEKAQGL